MVKATFNVEGMHCASCANSIEKVMKKVAGVKACQVNFGVNKMNIDYDPRTVSGAQIRQSVEKAGYKLS
ncbi:cation-translocating P-type ATPase [Candidatus Micrarchaeota archaeon]|nr:cation-translocating P-type ATPase [Candidatus Micrarchaeota archaeon]